MIVNPPIIFGKTAQLSCGTPHIRSNTHNVTSWLGGKDYSTLTFTGGTADPKKYAENRIWHRSNVCLFAFVLCIVYVCLPSHCVLCMFVFLRTMYCVLNVPIPDSPCF
jgi:hypothetical protein